MPWDDDQFEYTPGYVRLLIGSFFEKQEEVRTVCRDPFRASAMPYYDMLRAMDGITFTPKQWEAFYLRLCGYSYREIGFLFNVGHPRIIKRLRAVENKIIKFLQNEGDQTPPPADY